MTPSDRWPHVEQLYHDALARDEDERAAFLREACAGDETLRHEVELLLAYASDAQKFMDAPAIEMVGHPLSSAEAGGGAAEEAPYIGRRFGPYEIGSLLGSGGMGEVFRARDTKLGRDVAIKILPDALTKDADRARASNVRRVCSPR